MAHEQKEQLSFGDAAPELPSIESKGQTPALTVQTQQQRRNVENVSARASPRNNDTDDADSQPPLTSTNIATIGVNGDGSNGNVTASELAATSLPPLPIIPSSLLDPLESPSDSPRDPNAIVFDGKTLAQLLEKFTSAYTSQRNTMLACEASLKRLHSNCTSDLKNAIKSAEKRSVARMNLSECQSQHAKLVDRIARCQNEEAKLKREIADRQAKIDVAKDELHQIGAKLEGETDIHLQSVQSEIAQREQQLATIKADIDTTRQSLTSIRASNIEIFVELQSLQSEQSQRTKESHELDTEISRQNRTMSTLEARKLDLEQSMKSLQKRIAAKQSKITEKSELLDKLKKEETELVNTVKQQTATTEKMKAEDAAIEQQEREERTKLSALQSENSRALEEIGHLSKTIDNDSRHLHTVKVERAKKKKMLEMLLEQVNGSELEIAQKECDKADLEQQLAHCSAEEQRSQSSSKQSKDSAEFVEKQGKLLASQLESGRDALKAVEHALKIKENTIATLDNEIHSFEASLQRQKVKAVELNREIAQYTTMRDDVKAKCVSSQELLDGDRALITESEESCEFLRVKLANQSALLTAMHNDRDQYRASLIDLHTELKYERSMLVTKRMDVEDVRKRIAGCDRALTLILREKEEFEREVETIHGHITEAKSSLEHCQSQIGSLAGNKSHLASLCSDAKNEEKVQQAQFASVESECRVLTQQLMNRDSELHTVYDSLRLMQSRVAQSDAALKKLATMTKDKAGYYQSLEAMLDTVLEDVTGVQTLRESINQLKEKLIGSQRKQRALEDECATIINVHRWRSLRDGQGEMFGIVQQFHNIQKTIIQLNQQIADKAKEIEQQRQLQTQLDKLCAQSDTLVAASLEGEDSELEHELADKRAQSKAISNQLDSMMRAKDDLEREVSLFKREKQAIIAQWQSQRAERERKDKKARERELLSASLGGGDSEDDDDVLSRPSFVAGEQYDEHGNLVESLSASVSVPESMQEHKEQLSLS